MRGVRALRVDVWRAAGSRMPKKTVDRRPRVSCHARLAHFFFKEF
jgi:hypothetical protein